MRNESIYRRRAENRMTKEQKRRKKSRRLESKSLIEEAIWTNPEWRSHSFLSLPYFFLFLISFSLSLHRPLSTRSTLLPSPSPLFPMLSPTSHSILFFFILESLHFWTCSHLSRFNAISLSPLFHLSQPRLGSYTVFLLCTIKAWVEKWIQQFVNIELNFLHKLEAS